MALTWRGGLKPGDHVLVLGASGAVGQVGVQAARLLGAERVTAACRDAAGRARAAELGADAVADVSGDDVDAIASHSRRPLPTGSISSSTRSGVVQPRRLRSSSCMPQQAGSPRTTRR